MGYPDRKPVFWYGILAVAGLKLLLHLYANTIYGFHRDGLLYLSIGQHPAWGYWSNPPLIGWLGWIANHLTDGSVGAVRMLPTLAGCSLVVLAGLMAREMGAGRYGQFLAALAVLVSPAYLRSSMLFQPVIFDILGWTVLCYILLRYLNTEHRRYLFWFGIAFGVAFLNKYMVGFLLLALIPALLLTPARRVLGRREALYAAALALLITLPNLIWQYAHDFPVVQHMQALRSNQLVNVRPGDFLKDQLVMNFSAALVWIPGLWFLWKARKGAYRTVFYLFAGVILLLLLTKGKHYYSLGIYPVVIAAGGAFWENILTSRNTAPTKPLLFPRVLLSLLLLLLLALPLPLSVPLLPPAQMARYCRWTAENMGMDLVTRWEDGRQHALPQDFADMLGWPELGQAAVEAYRQLPPGTPVLIYGENYGEAGALNYFGRAAGLPPAVSFSDAYRLWLPDSTDAQTLIYVNDEPGEDVQAIFADIRPIGGIRDTFAREYGTTVYLCRQPRVSLDSFWRERVREVKESGY